MLLPLSGQQFTQQFNNFMVDDHHQDVALSVIEIQRGTVPQVQANALQALPTLDKHLIIALLLGGQASSS
jgi:uncharacterized protein DUF4142